MNYLYEYSTFESVQAMDETIKEHIEINQYELNDTDREIIITLERNSVKYKGVAHLKVDTIADIVSKSSITVRRSLNKLEALGIIEKIEFMRTKSGGNGANIYRFLAVDDRPEMIGRDKSENSDIASDRAFEGNNETINLLSDNTYILETETRPSKNNDFIKRSLKRSIPAPIYDALNPFYDGQGLYNAYGILLRAKAKIDRSITIEEYASDYIDVFKAVIRRFKAGMVERLDNYLYSAWESLSAEISRRKAYHSGSIDGLSDLLGY